MPSAALAQPRSLPRVLCLHGGGTNARIFRAQCRVIASQLAGSLRLVFADGPLPSVPGPDVTMVYGSWGPFRAWLPPSFIAGVPEGQSGDLALALIDEAIEAAVKADDDLGHCGPWVGVLGFSQGAKIAASLLLRQQRQAKAGRVPRFQFRFGILLAGRGPLLVEEGLEQESPMGKHAQSRHLRASTLSSDQKLSLPTLHVQGVRDPGLAMHRRMRNDWCAAGSSTILQWDGDHRVPIRAEQVSQITDYMERLAGKTGGTREIGTWHTLSIPWSTGEILC